MRWLVVFPLLLLASTAVPVFAQTETLGPISEEALPSPDPLAIQAALEESEREEQARERWLQSDEAERAREESRFAFVDLSAAEVKALLRERFGDQFAFLNREDPARVISDAVVQDAYAGEGATIKLAGQDLLLDGPVPTHAEEEDGTLAKIDLGLEATAGGFEAKNPLVDLSIDDGARGPIKLGEGDEEISITALGGTDSTAERFGEKDIFYFSTDEATDRLITPIATGVEIFELLRSARSPEAFRYQLALPEGASLQPAGEGAEVVHEGEALVSVPPPIAIDAQGADVPVKMDVEGDTLTLSVPHREMDLAYPAVVDPSFGHPTIEEDWYTKNWYQGYNTSDLYQWDWYTNSSWIYGQTYTIKKDFGGSGRGLHVSSRNGDFGPGKWGHWAYDLPNLNAYVEAISVLPFWYENHGCQKYYHQLPDDYVGLWDAVNQQWVKIVYNKAYYKGYANVGFPEENPGWGHMVMVGLNMGSGPNIPCWRDFYAGGALVYLSDWADPTISNVGGVPSDWIADGESFTITASAYDAGLGVREVKYIPEDDPTLTQSVGCSGLAGDRCPTSFGSQKKIYEDNLEEGRRWLRSRAFDALGKESDAVDLWTRVDRTPPETILGGQLAVATEEAGSEEKPAGEGDELTLPVYELTIDATDGSNADDDLRRSGVKDIRVSLDGVEQEVSWEAQSCPQDSCPMYETYDLELEGLEPGEHLLEVDAEDHVGKVRYRDVEFKYAPVTSATTLAAADVKAAAATLNGNVNPGGAATSYRFEYGQTTSYGTKAPIPDEALGAGTQSISVDKLITDLEPNATYHFRAVAVNSKGTFYGPDETFTTTEWATVPPVESAGNTSNFTDVWCLSSSNCVAVGSWDASGANHAQIKHWGGGAWGIQQAPVPDGASTSSLEGVTCTSSSFCAAVGSYDEQQPDTTSITKALAMSWDGEEWSIVTTPNPSGASSTVLSEVSCTSKSSCMAVGRYTDSEAEQRTLTMSWNGTDWTIVASPNASEGSLNELSGVDCTGSSSCLAVGSFVNSNEVTKTLAMAWNGSAWSIQSTPEPSGASLNQLADVDCYTALVCRAAGTYFDSEGVQKTLVLRRVFSSWSIESTPNPSAALSSELKGISCSETSQCTAVGSYKDGTGQAPMAIRLNGSSWSEQAVDSASFGAISVALSAVSCAAGTACHAAGSITYGHGGDRRDTAFAWDGSGWSGSKSSSLVRTWDRQAVANFDSSLTDVQCFSTLENCVETGTFTDGFGSKRGHIIDGSDTATPAPAGAENSAIEAMSCATETKCVAVGTFHDVEDEELGLIVYRDESGLTAEQALAPTGVESRLKDVDCISATHCIAVGSSRDPNGGEAAHAIAWDGSEWSQMNASAPPGSFDSELLGVSCATETICAAVGRYVDSSGKPRSLALAWDGTAWTSINVSLSFTTMSDSLKAVACPSSAGCVAVGSYVDTEGAVRTLALRSSEEAPQLEWEASGTPSQEEGTTTTLVDISCQDLSNCLAVGALTDSEGLVMPFGFVMSEGSWSDLGLQAPQGVVEDGYHLKAVTCLDADECAAVGSVTAPQGHSEDFRYTIVKDEGQWQVDGEAGGPSSGGFDGVSCVRTDDPTAPSCIAVGTLEDPLGARSVSWLYTGDAGWVLTPFGSETGELTDVDCATPVACTAVGDGTSTWTVRRWDGTSWSAQAPEAIPGASDVKVEGVSCPSENSCKVVGSYVKEGETTPLVGAWDGSTWSVETSPQELNGEPIALKAISCPTSESCVAVGHAVSGNHAVVERWSESTWTAEAPPAPGETTSAKLIGVSCSSVAACTAVGSYRTTSSGEGDSGLIVRWDGASWSLQGSPSIEGSTSTSLGDVSCFSDGGCVAVAEGDVHSMVAWNGIAWEVETTSFGAGQAFTGQSASVSCSAAIDCIAAGSIEGEGEEMAPLALNPLEDALGSSGEEGTAEESPIPPLSDEQIEQAETIIAEDPELKAKIGTAEYTPTMIPWTEEAGEGESVLIGVAGMLVLDEAQGWTEYQTWPAVTWNSPIEPDPYTETTMSAMASDVIELQFNLVAVVDESENFVDGELVQLEPMDEGDAEVILEDAGPYEGEDPVWSGY